MARLIEEAESLRSVMRWSDHERISVLPSWSGDP